MKEALGPHDNILLHGQQHSINNKNTLKIQVVFYFTKYVKTVLYFSFNIYDFLFDNLDIIISTH